MHRFKSWYGFALLALGTVVGLPIAIAPSVTQAYTARLEVTLDHQKDETYDTLLRRAELTARAAVQRSFDQDILATEASVIISAQTNGRVAPILKLDVSRFQWRNRPDPQAWATYFRTSRSLLGFTVAQPAASATPPPAAAPAPTPAPTPTPGPTPTPTPSPAPTNSTNSNNSNNSNTPVGPTVPTPPETNAPATREIPGSVTRPISIPTGPAPQTVAPQS